MSDDKQRPYDDFFNRKDTSRKEVEQTDDETAHVSSPEGTSNPFHYYSYDSVKHNETKPEHEVEVRQPTPVTAWSVPKPKKSSGLRKGFLTFLVGAIVMAGLMFVADQGNWFSQGDIAAMSNDSVANNAANGASTSDEPSSSNGNVKNANLPDVVRPNNIAEIFNNASPAVVKIETFAKASNLQGQRGNLFDSPFFRQFFGDQFDTTPQTPQSNNNSELIQMGMGSGFFFEKDGYILTNQHVIAGADEIMVMVQGYDEPFKAQLLGNEFDLDLAVIKIEGDNFPFLQLGNVDDLNIGDWVVAIGNPYGFDHTVTVGVLSAKERPINIPDAQERETRRYKHLLQTDASINPGNSGGPLLNLNGEVIGINTAVSTQAQGIGFAIPTSTVNEVLTQLKDNVKIPSPYIGVLMANIQESWVEELGIDSTDGVIIRSTINGSPAEIAGIQPYDVILAIDGEKVKNTEDVVEKIKSKKIGDVVQMQISRDGTKMTTAVKIGDENAG